MGKCGCPKKRPKKKSCGRKKRKSTCAPKKPKCGRKGHPANMFILFFLDTWRKEGGNMYCMAKECGKRWKTLPQCTKDKYQRKYCAKAGKRSRVCNKKKGCR